MTTLTARTELPAAAVLILRVRWDGVSQMQVYGLCADDDERRCEWAVSGAMVLVAGGGDGGVCRLLW